MDDLLKFDHSITSLILPIVLFLLATISTIIMTTLFICIQTIPTLNNKNKVEREYD